MNVRPDRIVVSRQGRARLVDFGPDRTYVSGHETVGCVWGGVQYISPEQANEDEHVDIRSDIYALGATLFHAATGRPPFADASDTMVSLKHLNARLPLARELNPQLSKTTESLLAKMLARDPNDRYQTPKDLLHDLVPFHARLEAIKERQVASQEHPVAPASPAMEPPPASVSPVQGEVAPAAVPVPDASPEQPSPQPPVPTDMAPEAADGGVPLPASPMAQDVVPGAAEPLPSAKPHVKPPRGRKKVLVVSIIVGALVLAGLLTFLRPAWFPNVFRGFGVTRSAEPPPEDTPPESPP